MIRWLLERYEEQPNASFTQAELLRFGTEEFDRARVQGFIRQDPPPADLPMRVVGDRLLNLVPTSSGWEGFDPLEPDEPPVLVSPDEVTTWTLDVLAVAREFASRHRLAGVPEAVSPRIVSLGEAAPGHHVVLGLFSSAADAATSIAAVPELIGQRPRLLSVVTAHFSPPHALRRAARWIRWERLASDELDTTRPLLDVQSGYGGSGASVEFHSDFSWVAIDGEPAIPSPNEGLVLTYLARNPGPHAQNAFLERLEIKSARVHDVFKGGKGRKLKDAFLVHRGDGIWEFRAPS